PLVPNSSTGSALPTGTDALAPNDDDTQAANAETTKADTNNAQPDIPEANPSEADAPESNSEADFDEANLARASVEDVSRAISQGNKGLTELVEKYPNDPAALRALAFDQASGSAGLVQAADTFKT